MRLGDLAAQLGARLLGDPLIEVRRMCAVDEAGPDDLAFADAPTERRAALCTRAAAVLVGEDFAADHAHELPCASLVVDSPGRGLADAIRLLHPPPARPIGVHPRAVVHPLARLAADVAVGPLAVVGKAVLDAGVIVGPLAVISDDVEVGAGSVVGPGAVLMSGTRVGVGVTVGPGAVVGDEGFVHAPLADEAARNIAVPHVAGVVLEDGAAVGANACVDRGVLRHTRVGARALVDNLVQVGHDVVIGEDAVIVAQVGIAGHARVGAAAVLAGQAGVGDHQVVGAGARVGGQAGVTRDVAPGAAVSGTPAIPHMQWLRAMARLKDLDQLERRLGVLEQHLALAPRHRGDPAAPGAASPDISPGGDP